MRTKEQFVALIKADRQSEATPASTEEAALFWEAMSECVRPEEIRAGNAWTASECREIAAQFRLVKNNP